MIIASVDIGTNTVILLIARLHGKKIFPLYNEQRIPRIGKELIPGKEISREKEKVLMDILGDYKKKITEYHCEKTIAVATNAFRIASNGEKIAREIKNKFNIEVKIVSGEEEAKLSFLGAASGFGMQKNLTVIDIGGGSTELIFGNIDHIGFRKSLPIGVVSLTERYLSHDPPIDTEINELKMELDHVLSEIRINFFTETAVAIAGTPTTLACIQKGLAEFDEEAIEGSLLNRNDLEKFISILSGLKKNEILGKYKSVVKGREDVLLCGTVILNGIMNLLKINEVFVSTRGIRYGAVLEYLVID